MNRYNTLGNNNQPFKYNGKEYETMLSWNMSDYGARWQDPAIGRFSTIDPHSEKYYNLSPYAYCGNNPINYIDPNGLDSIYYDQSGIELYRYGNDTSINNIYVIKTTMSTKEIYGEHTNNYTGKTNPISPQDYYETRIKIIDGIIEGDHMRNVVSFGTLQQINAMMNVIQDDGTGGNTPQNNREYSGYFDKNGNIVHCKQSRIGNLKYNKPIITHGDPDFHSHPSGTMRIKNMTLSWMQPPSMQDIKTARKAEYVIGMGNCVIYKYNNKGVFAIFHYHK